MERETPWEVKFFGGEGWGFLGKIYVGTPPPPDGGLPRTERFPLSLRDISPPRGESPLSGEAFEVDGEKCLI